MKRTIKYFLIVVGISFIIPILFSRKFELQEVAEVDNQNSIETVR